LLAVAANPAGYERMRRDAALWAQRFSLEGLREAIRKLLLEHWTDGAAGNAPETSIVPAVEK
jgi:hypothetical protein